MRETLWLPPSRCLKKLYDLFLKAHIANTTVTGYGEGLIKAGFNADYGIIETMAHYKAAERILAGSGLYPGHRRPGHEVHEDKKTTLFTA